MSQQSTPPERPVFAPEEETHEDNDVQQMHAAILREKTEPREGYEPIHPAWALVFGVLVFACGYYLAAYSGDFRADVFNENRGATSAPQADKPVDQNTLLENVGKAALRQPPMQRHLAAFETRL